MKKVKFRRLQLHKFKQRKSNKGMSMVEVLVGFVILVGILGGLSGSIAFAQKMYMNSVDLHRQQEVIMRNIYKKDLLDGKSPSQTELKLYVVNPPLNSAGSEKITDAKFTNGDEVKLNIAYYRMSTSVVNGESDSSVGDMMFHLFQKVEGE